MNISEETKVSKSSECVNIEMREDCENKRDDNKKSDLKQNEKDAKRDGNKKSDLKQNEKMLREMIIRKVI